MFCACSTQQPADVNTRNASHARTHAVKIHYSNTTVDLGGKIEKETMNGFIFTYICKT
jgi:hypothetical protein